MEPATRQHIYETGFESVAADMRFAKGTPAQWAAEAKRLRAKAGGKGGVGRYDRSGFVHVDNRGYAATGRADAPPVGVVEACPCRRP